MRNISRDFIIFLAIICSKSLLLEGSSLHQYVNGSLKEQCSFSVTIFLETIEGVLLYIFDSERNQFGVIITNTKFLCINYNNLSQCRALFTVCGCDSCKGRWMEIELELSTSVITVTCNNQKSQTLLFKDLQTRSKEEERYFSIMPLPKEMIKEGHERLFIMIGNIGPYTSENNVECIPLKEQIVGCLDKFAYNKQIIALKESGGKVLRSCPNVCNNDFCNGGLCQRKSVDDFLCDCSMTALNGDYCNKSLEEYEEGRHNSYEKIKDSPEIYFKLTWKVRSQKKYCLVNVEGGKEDLTVWLNKEELKMNEEVITTVTEEQVYFMKGTLNNNGFTLETNNKTLKRKLLFDGNAKINVGLSTKNRSCDTFEGMYDFLYDLKNIRQIPQIIRSIPQSVTKTNNNNNGGNRIITKIVIPSAAAVMFITLLICGIKMILNSSGRDEEVSNDDNEEGVVEFRETNTERGLHSTSGVYSTIDYMKMFNPIRSDNEDSDGYILPKPPVINELSPPLPPRNEQFL